jgi:hypothetical protein
MNNSAIHRVGKILILCIWGILPALAFAQIPPPPVTAPQQIASLGQILNPASICGIINWIFWLVIVLAVIFTLLTAFKYLTAAGDPEKVKSAGTSLIYVVVAIVVALLAKGLPLIISSFIGGGLSGVGC